MKIVEINSLDYPELYPYRTLKFAAEHRKKGIFVAEGKKVVSRLLESKIEILSFLIAKEHWEEMNGKIIKRCSSNVSIYLGTKKLLESIVGFNLHQGVMAVGKIPTSLTIDDVLKKYSANFIVALDGLTNSDNLGVIVRNCVSFSVNALIVGETSSSPYLRRAVRQSMGAIFELPVIESKNLANDLFRLSKEYNFQVIAADPHGEISLREKFNLSENICLVLGSEGYGIREDVLPVCNVRISIPISVKVDSLNVASASAIFLYVINQRL